MKGILTRNEDGIWMVKWSDLHSFAHGTHWMYTELSNDSNSIKYIKDNLIMVKPLEEGVEVEFEMVTSGYDENNFIPFNSAKLIFPDVDKFEKEEYIFDNKEVDVSLPGSELSDIDSLKYFFEKYLFSVERGKPNQNGATILKMWIDIIQQRNNRIK
jgi:hypothetical protein